MSSPCAWLYDFGSLTCWQASERDAAKAVFNRGFILSRPKRCSLPKLWLVQLPSPGLGLVVVVAPSLMSKTLQRTSAVHAWPYWISRVYTSFPTTTTETVYTSFPMMRNETKRAGVVVQHKEQQSNVFFPLWLVETPENLETPSIRFEPRKDGLPKLRRV